MGFLSLKKEYNIEHIVAVYDKEVYGEKVICIGSAYIHDIIVIDMRGTILKRYESRNNDDLCRYQKEFDEDPERFIATVTKEDDFSDYQTNVYIYDNGRIRKELCEEIGWLHTTTSGELMYNNNSFDTYKKAFDYACSSAKISRWDRINYRRRILGIFNDLKISVKYQWILRLDWLYVNTILRVKSWFVKD